MESTDKNQAHEKLDDALAQALDIRGAFGTVGVTVHLADGRPTKFVKHVNLESRPAQGNVHA